MIKRNPIEVFSEWADLDKDLGMEKNHNKSVEKMLDYALKDPIKAFSFIDAGCGNGWVVRKVAQLKSCLHAEGVDGSENMIQKAKKIDPSLSYSCADLMVWNPKTKVDIVHSMEVLYYLDDPKAVIQRIFNDWLKPKGRLIIGIDFYLENKVSHNWSESCGINNMKLFSQQEWFRFFTAAGFQNMASWHQGAQKNWAGTLIITGVK
ncbi:class I SAM-dependent methyltransferase [Flavobacteriaceae bacterium]|jgi:trans-aconitate methyltransferase|nr:class I SAM-dependent methyltransferase [Flavobacteriaceae bacterium]